jgi:hypothetical protein
MHSQRWHRVLRLGTFAAQVSSHVFFGHVVPETTPDAGDAPERSVSQEFLDPASFAIVARKSSVVKETRDPLGAA